ncbi:MAG: ABC transporter substrate-binding protein [Anaerolineae bacterium]|nr:ABC transporter substrate-binding protein [Anaerolineae bacterium]
MLRFSGWRSLIWLISAFVLVGLLGACSSASPAPSAQPPSAPQAQPTQAAVQKPAQPAPAQATTAPAAQPTQAQAKASGAGTPKKGGTLIIGQDFPPQHFDPHKSNAWANTNITESIYEGLLRWNDKETALEPQLATSYTMSPDGLTYTFKIRQGVKFHNGRVMTADDVKASLDRMRDSKSGSVVFNDFKDVTAVDIVDPETVKITLGKPVATFLNNLTETRPIVPKEAFAELETKPVGTGPFKLEKYTLNQSVMLVRNADYWDQPKPYLDAVEFKILGDEASKEAALRSKSVDMTWFRDPRQAENVSKALQGVVSAPGIPSRFINIRLNMCQKPFDDVKVRRALSLAIDRKGLVETVIPSKYGGSVGAIVAPSDRFFWKGDTMALPYYKQDVAQAKKLLADAGYANGVDIEAYKVVAANQLDVDAAQVLKEMWNQVGIRVTIQPLEAAQAIKDYNEGGGKMAQVGQVWQSDPDGFLYNSFHSSSPQAKAFCVNDPEMDKLLEQGRSDPDAAKRADAYQKIQERVADQVYNIVLYGYPLRWEMWWDYVKGYQNKPSNTRWNLRQSWLEK